MPRKKPFSGKQKKLQLQEKRNRKDEQRSKEDSKFFHAHEEGVSKDSTSQLNKGEYNPNRYKLNFLRETAEEVARRKLQSQQEEIEFVNEQQLEISVDDVYPPDSVLEMPKRPKWSYNMSKQKLEQQESNYFKEYIQKIHSEYGNKNLSYFEHNLETWRQAWRVLERSDVIVMVTDVRHPVLHFSPTLYNHVTVDLNKPLILVLNKVDLVPANLIAAWTDYFQTLYPKLQIVWFTSFPKEVRKIDLGTKIKRKPNRKRIYQTQMGPSELLNFCKKICGNEVDLSSWEDKITRDLEKLEKLEQNKLGDEEDIVEVDERMEDMSHIEGSGAVVKRFHRGVLTLGFLGHPNVGKSSLMNGLMGRKVVSTSITPGHTKYYQTYFLTPTVRLCDSPGLVFPSLIDKQMQILSGIYPISQVQEPYSSVGYLASRLPIVDMLKLKPSIKNNDENKEEERWTPWSICEAWAMKKRYMTAKAARADVYRAANSILRMAVDGRLCLYMRPPGFTDHKDDWDSHEVTRHLLDLKIKSHMNDDDSDEEAMSACEHDDADDLDDERDVVTSTDDDSASSDDDDDDNDLFVSNKFAGLEIS